MARSRPFAGKSGLLSAAAVAVLALAGTVTSPATAIAGSSGGGASAATRTSAVSKGSSTPTAGATPAAAAKRHQLPVLRPRATTRGGRTASNPAAPQTSSNGTATSTRTASPALLHNFDGVDAIDNKRASGFDLEPPDEGLGANDKYVVNFVNVTGQIQNTAGAVLVQPFYLNTFFHESDAANTSDPRVFWDNYTQRWISTILVYGYDFGTNQVTDSHIDVAISRTADPRGSWRIYSIDASNPLHAGCPCLADYPILGVGRDNIYISTNEFDKTLTQFNGSQLYALSLSQLESGVRKPNVVFYENLSAAGSLAFHVQPANTYGPSGVEYLMSSLDPYNTYDNRLVVWALTGTQKVATGGIPALSAQVISSEAYSLPPDAQTPPGFCSGSACGPDGLPTSGLVATDFDAMQEVQYINGNLVGALNTAVNLEGESGPRAGAAWFVVRPQVTNEMVTTATKVTRQGYVAQRSAYLLYPHINMTENGAMAMTFGLGGPGTYLSAAYATAPPGGRFGQIKFAAAGVAPDNGFTGTDRYGPVARWGDYSNGQIIVGTNRVWLATQYIPNTGDGNANWGNRIFEVQLG